MKIILSPDSFKGSISAFEAAEAIRQGILSVLPEAQVICLPIADGGEGTLETLVRKENRIRKTVTAPDFSSVEAEYGMEGDTAIIEMAEAAGLTLLKEEKRSAGDTTTFGVGELILDALGRGCRRILLTVGGSATNDGGCGMMRALGVRFYDGEGKTFIPVGRTLANIEGIDLSDLTPRLRDCEIVIATDVKNPLCGEEGATYVYGPQKGADARTLKEIETGMLHYARLLLAVGGLPVEQRAGCGAGGGIAAPLVSLLGAKIRSGIEAVLDSLRFSELLTGSDAVVTGEGRLDTQSLFGKAISGVTQRAAKASVPVYCLVGSVKGDPRQLKALGLEEIYSIVDRAESVEDAIANADKYLRLLGADLAKELKQKENRG